MSIKLIPRKRSSTVSILARNTNSKSRVPTPAGFVTSIAKTLKLGDGVRVGYSRLGRSIWITSLARLPAPSKSNSSGQDSADRFIFVGARKVRTPSGLYMRVVARKGSGRWTFNTPVERVAATSGSGSQSDPGAGVSAASMSLSKKISQFSTGDIVAMEYDTVNFKLVLSDISRYMMTAVGNVTRTGERTMLGAKHTTVYIRAGKLNLMLVVPKVNRPGGSDVAELASTIKSLGKQEATFKYYRRKSVMWIDEVTRQ